MRSTRRHDSKSQRERAALLALVLLVPLACAQGQQDTLGGDDDMDTGGSDPGTAGASAGLSGAGRAGVAGSPVSGGAGETGGAGKSGASAGGKGGSSGGVGVGGKSGAGGSVGSAGKGGTSSGGASAGSPNGGASVGGALGSGGAAVAGFSVKWKNEHTATPSSYLGGEILVHNAGPNSLGVSDLKVRYYFTDEPKVMPKFNNNFQHISTSGSQFDLTVTMATVGMAPTATTADTYIEFSFSSPHATLAPNEDLDFAWQMQGQNPAMDSYNQANDWSFDASKTSLTNWEHIVLLQGTNLLWGSPP
jgi:endoglucanase